MPRRAKAKGVYQRGPYWLGWDERADGTRRSPFLAIFWYDPERGRVRSTSTGTGELEPAKLKLDAHYLDNSAGAAICPNCGQPRSSFDRFYLVHSAIADYTVAVANRRDSAQAIKARLAHVLDYLDTLLTAAVYCHQIDEAWIERFRAWAIAQPIITPSGVVKRRSPSTVENSVLQLAAVINAAHKRGEITRPAQFRPIQLKELNRTPQHRSDIDQLAEMFRYASKPSHSQKRAALHRFLILSVATLCRPDAAHDVSADPRRDQWNSERRVLRLNPRGRRQTRKYRATVRLPRQVAPWLDLDVEHADRERPIRFFVPVKSVRSAWDTMAEDLKLPKDGEAGLKLIRRSMAQLLRERGVPNEQVEMQLGHRRIDSVSELYAPFSPDFLKEALAEVEAIIDEIESRAPGAFHRTNTGLTNNVVRITPIHPGIEKPRRTRSPPGFSMVGVSRIELATPAMSTQCSTTELHARRGMGL